MNKPSSREIQTHRNAAPLLRKQIVKLGSPQVFEKIGGRDRVRTCDPLLAKHESQLQPLYPLIITTNVSNKSGNLLSLKS